MQTDATIGLFPTWNMYAPGRRSGLVQKLDPGWIGRAAQAKRENRGTWISSRTAYEVPGLTEWMPVIVCKIRGPDCRPPCAIAERDLPVSGDQLSLGSSVSST